MSQDYGFDYSDDDDDDNNAGSADVENMYYTAKCMCFPVRFEIKLLILF